MRVVQIKQASGAIRVILLSNEDAALVERDADKIGEVTVLGAVDAYRDGRREWGRIGPRYRDIPTDVRETLSYYVRGA